MPTFHELLEISRSERAQYFQEAAARSHNIKNQIIIEKDFLVCWTLDRIFSSATLSLLTAELIGC